jgi:dienelactone hydrolase
MSSLSSARRSGSFLVAVLGLGTGLALAQQPAPAAAPPGPPQMAEINKLPDNVGTGHYPALKEEVASLPAHVVYRPKDLSAVGAHQLGVVAWGNGGCSDDGASTRFHLLELASHGYLVIASGKILSGPGSPPRPAPPPGAAPAGPPAPGQLPPPRTKASDLNTAIDWALAENKRKGSAYYGKINPKMVAVSGFSCGGIQAISAAKDPRVTAVVLQNTGIFNDGASPIPGMDLKKDALNDLHTPVIYILGGSTDIAYKNGMDDFQRIDKLPVAVANLQGAGHGGSYFKPDGGPAASVAVSWLEWQLRGDKQAAKRFVGKDCGLCTDPQWTFEKKRIP